MTSDIVIRAEGLGKKYIIGHQSTERSNTFRDVITQNVKNFVRGAKEMAQGKAIVAGDELEEFWALKEVNFEIRRGDVVGIIGRNGAGKSTLLKVLSRITEPTEGRVEIKGRVASLLEVGTGFHPELSGRENIYLNGAILGMSRAEINRKFDEIVDFSGVEKFLDTPVKRYSSGMYVRLAFAVAAHLEPEILIVDEVLAVGDAEFQKKCLGKMKEVAGAGRTVIFVSHNMAAVNILCNSGIVLDGGGVKYIGSASSALDVYKSGNRDATQHILQKVKLDGFKELNLKFDILQGTLGLYASVILSGVASLNKSFCLELAISDQEGQYVLFCDAGTRNPDNRWTVQIGTFETTLQVPLCSLAEGDYFLTFQITRPGESPLLRLDDVEKFSVYREDSGIRFQKNWGWGSVVVNGTLNSNNKAAGLGAI